MTSQIITITFLNFFELRSWFRKMFLHQKLQNIVPICVKYPMKYVHFFDMDSFKLLLVLYLECFIFISFYFFNKFNSAILTHLRHFLQRFHLKFRCKILLRIITSQYINCNFMAQLSTIYIFGFGLIYHFYNMILYFLNPLLLCWNLCTFCISFGLYFWK